MKRMNLFLSLIPVFVMFFVFEISACSCLCFNPRINYDSLLDIHSTGNGSGPDSTVKKFLSKHQRMFWGTIVSVEVPGDDTEMVKVKINTVIKGQINFDTLNLINIPHHGDCVSSANLVKGLSFLGCIDSEKVPVHLRELGFWTALCGSGLVGYLYQSGSLIRVDDVPTGKIDEYLEMECNTEVSRFDIGKLFSSPVKEKIMLRNSYYNDESTPQYYSITGKKLNKLRTNSVVIVSNNKRENIFLKVLKLAN